jgi:hypothetical protein
MTPFRDPFSVTCFYRCTPSTCRCSPWIGAPFWSDPNFLLLERWKNGRDTTMDWVKCQWLFNKVSFGLLLITCFLFSNIFSYGADLPDVPMHHPFEIHKKGNIAEIDIGLKRDSAVYEFFLGFKFDRNDYKDRKRVSELVGDVKGINMGIETPINLQITRMTSPGEGRIVDYTFKNQKLRSWGANSFKRHIASISLSRGKYRIRVESLKDNQELNNIPIELVILYPKR